MLTAFLQCGSDNVHDAAADCALDPLQRGTVERKHPTHATEPG
jgi:hypothetical protein